MHKAVSIIKDEHRTISAVLDATRTLVARIRNEGRRPDFRVFRAILYYLDTLTERYHHSKEERYLVAALRQHIPKSAASAVLINGIGIDQNLDRDPLDGVSDKEDFGRLLTRIVTLAPAPVGVGPDWPRQESEDYRAKA